MTSSHAQLSPSSAHRWMGCPGSVRLCAELPDVPSEYAAEGTFAHSIAAHCLKTGHEAVHMVGQTDDTYTCDEEMAGHVQVYLDAVYKVAPLVSNAVLLVEQKVSLVGVRDDVHGTADAIVISADGKHLDVFDFKYGAGVLVDVEANPQLMIYALGALLSLGNCANVETVNIHVVQPRHHSGGHRCFALYVDELSSLFSAEVRLATAAVDKALRSDVDEMLKTGDHCRWCLAKPHCPELRKVAMERTRHLFEDVSSPSLVMVPAKSPPPAGSLSTAELGSALAAFPLIEEWMKAVREHAYDRAARGDTLPGFKLVEKTGNRAWVDEGAVALVMEAYDAALHAKPKLLSPAQAEKGLPKEHRAGLMSQLARKPKTGAVLVPTADKRPAVTAGDVFETIET